MREEREPVTKNQGLVGEMPQLMDILPTWLWQIIHEEGRLTLTDTEGARLMGVSRGSMRAAIAEGEIHAVRLGRRLLIPVIPLLELVGLEGAHGEPAVAPVVPAVPALHHARHASDERSGG